jgi:hypothetical protein
MAGRAGKDGGHEQPLNAARTSIHLFAIRYSNELRDHPLRAVTKEAGVRKSYVTEIGKGMRLARHVTPR